MPSVIDIFTKFVNPPGGILTADDTPENEVFASILGMLGGGGASINAVNVPRGQNANAIANGQSYSLTYQPYKYAGSTVTKSPGSGPPVVGPSVGTRIPFAASYSFNMCLRNCGC